MSDEITNKELKELIVNLTLKVDKYDTVQTGILTSMTHNTEDIRKMERDITVLEQEKSELVNELSVLKKEVSNLNYIRRSKM